ncbi:MAG: DUF2306 domain-containing protein [Flavobacteriaceae bacterium]|nr:DUF2306 domain-containing protein [Flavobacteriaceae bacterium]
MEVLKEVISWTHTITATLSLIFGSIVLFGIKGNAKHKKMGLWYFYAMLINNLTALAIVNAFGKWFFPHYLAIACLIVIIPGIVAIRQKHKHWLKVHIISMVISYYLLVGGAINEAFLHIPKLRPYIINNEPILGITHMIAQLIFIGVLIYFLRKYRKFGTNNK